MEFNGMENGEMNEHKKAPAEKIEKLTPEKVVPENQENYNKKADVLDTEKQINELTSELGLIEKWINNVKNHGISSPELSGKREGILNEIGSLEDKKTAWLEDNGEEELPEGISIEKGEEDSMMKLDLDQEQAEKMSKEERRKLIDDWEKKAVKNFTDVMKSNWRTSDAINLPIVLDVIKNNVPLSIEKQSKKFLDGNDDSLPNAVVVSWKHASILERLKNKPNQIRELSISFDGKIEIIAGEEDLIEQNKKDEALEQNNLEKAA